MESSFSRHPWGMGSWEGLQLQSQKAPSKSWQPPLLAASLQEVQSHPDEVPPGNRCICSLPLPLMCEQNHPLNHHHGRALLFFSQALLGTPPLWGLSSPEEAPCPHSSGSTSMDTASMGSEPRLHPPAPPNGSSRAFLPSLHT